MGTLTADEGARLMALEDDLGRRVKGQPEAISAVAEAVRLARAGLKKPGRSMGVFLFVGHDEGGQLSDAIRTQTIQLEAVDSRIQFCGITGP